jgi:hypothetical protein
VLLVDTDKQTLAVGLVKLVVGGLTSGAVK